MNVYLVESRLLSVLVASKNSTTAESYFKKAVRAYHKDEYDALISNRSRDRFLKMLNKKYFVNCVTQIGEIHEKEN